MNPELVRGYDLEVLQVAVVMEADPAEVKRWDARDRRWLLAFKLAEIENEKEPRK